DEEDFRSIEMADSLRLRGANPVRLLHSGLIYPDDRNPLPFFQALARLKREGRVDARRLSIDLRAPGFESHYSTVLKELGIDDITHLLPAVPYSQVLREGAEADALLLFQAATCNHQIPAKIYEYMRLGKPILAITAEAGDTAALLRDVGGSTRADLEDEEAIYAAFPGFLDALERGIHPVPDAAKVSHYDRRYQARLLARQLDSLVRGEDPGTSTDEEPLVEFLSASRK
ncbi:MAG: glycosyltransferase, partial [Acidobacteria bacterium]|nr:glycosyltransferase [Acidobacteriota bacterium]